MGGTVKNLGSIRNAKRSKAPDIYSDWGEMMLRAMDRREARNPLTEALHLLHFTLPKAFGATEESQFTEYARQITDGYFRPMLKDKTFTEATMNEFIRDAFAKGWHIDLVEEVTAYCAFAFRAFFDGNEALAWTYISDARYWAGVVAVSERHRGAPGPATLLANMRHAKERSQYVHIEDYWRANIDQKLSAQKAADKVVIAGVTTFGHKKIAEIVSALRRGETFR